MKKIKKIFSIKNNDIMSISTKYLRKISYINEKRKNYDYSFSSDIYLNSLLKNKIIRRSRNNKICKRSYNDLVPAIYFVRKSWKHNSKRKNQF